MASDNLAFLLFIIGACLAISCILLIRKLWPVVFWLYKINKNYTYFQKATGISKIQAVFKIGHFIYQQSQLDYRNRQLERNNLTLLHKVERLQLENSLLRKNICPRRRRK